MDFAFIVAERREPKDGNRFEIVSVGEKVSDVAEDFDKVSSDMFRAVETHKVTGVLGRRIKRRAFEPNPKKIEDMSKDELLSVAFDRKIDVDPKSTTAQLVKLLAKPKPQPKP
jgi:hypothetical protein